MKEIRFRDHILPLKDKLFRLALRITLHREEAEDIVQDTLLRVWEKRETWPQIESIEAYCTTICRNLALDRNAAARNSNLRLDEQMDTPPLGTTPFEDRKSNSRQPSGSWTTCRNCGEASCCCGT